ncbi:hypothetical protein M404DRAFT_336692 [Pisolithus tinctorius Marx 270]|uniref:Uncharacterized protein n=1 Tax=Pisolithus tinctorius Marx 270 TaxID=870435 RepID=A0A0C3ID25_PISTI|nr:hypothetical protein M404DRAFT_336692 [Pisolithus tinctorius Marx 270]
MAGAAGRHLVYHAGAQTRPVGFAVRSQFTGRCADVEKSVSFSGWSDLVNKVIAGLMCLGPNLTHPGRLAFRTLFPECWRFGNVPSSPHFERIKYGVHRTLLRLKASPISFLLRHPHSPFIRCSCFPSDSNPRQPFYQVCVVVHPTPHNCPTRILRVTVRRRHSPAM